MIGTMKKRLQKKPKQTTFIYCEKCNNELCSSGSFVSDTYDEKGNNHVLYKCSKCGHECDYNFDIAPVPIKWSELRSGAQQLLQPDTKGEG